MKIPTVIKKKIIKYLCICIALLIVIGTPLILWAWSENKALQVNTYHISSSELHRVFSSFRIAQIADLHNEEFGEGNQELLALLKKNHPDIIVFTGDLIDARRTDYDLAVDFATEAVKIAPCYMVTGNHEGSLNTYPQFLDRLSEAGVTVLENDITQFTHQGETITIMGVDDVSLQAHYGSMSDSNVILRAMNRISTPPEGFTILLAHHPELLDAYAEYGVDLVLAGHAHGGQIRIPGIGGVIAPNQGLFPEYDGGLYTMDDTSMVVSRGLGNSLFPLRFNNPPELVMVELHATN